MTGGYGHRHLHHFYTNYFVHCNPADMTSIPISRTVGATQVVDEALLSFTHDVEIPWMLPGIPPTGKRIEVALISVRSEERRVGKECVSTCRSRWGPYS